MVYLKNRRKASRQSNKPSFVQYGSNKNYNSGNQDTLNTDSEMSEFPDVSSKNVTPNSKNFKKIKTRVVSPNIRKLELGKMYLFSINRFRSRKRKESLANK